MPAQPIVGIFHGMPIPEATSVEAFSSYVGGKRVKQSQGKAWRGIKAWLGEPLRHVDTVPLPAVSETALAWTASGEAEFQEREGDGPWTTHHIKRGSFFLTSGGAPYECRWRTLTPDPFITLQVFVERPLLQQALEEELGANAQDAQIRDLSAFTDPDLSWLMEQVRVELLHRKASALRVQGLAHMIATHLARKYAYTPEGAKSSSPALPGFKLRQITDALNQCLAEEFSLTELAEMAGLSKYHFCRLFKEATGVSPSQYHLNLRMDAARRLLRESDASVVNISLEVGYNNPSRFAQLFHRETGMTPSEYRRKR